MQTHISLSVVIPAFFSSHKRRQEHSLESNPSLPCSVGAVPCWVCAVGKPPEGADLHISVCTEAPGLLFNEQPSGAVLKCRIQVEVFAHTTLAASESPCYA